MPKGVYERTDWHKSRLQNLFQPEHKTNIGNDWNVGRVRPKYERDKIRASMMGEKNHFYGKNHSNISRDKMSESQLKLNRQPNEGSFKKGESPWNKDKEMTEEYSINMSLARTGKKEFDGFTMSENHRFRTQEKYKRWRDEVFERDDYTCQLCNIRGRYLHAHHKISVKEMLNKKLKELYYDTNNGITLCGGCHDNVHGGKQNEILKHTNGN